MTTSVIQLIGVGRLFGKNETPALDDVSLEIARGEFVAVVGQSGAGKSTLLNILGLLDNPDSGSYRINGIATENLPESARDRLRAETFGFVFQDSFVLPTETVARNVALPLRMSGVDQATQLTTVAEALDQFGLLDKSNQIAATLSGGERQRVAFARAISNRPLVLLADEPTGNLDSLNTSRVLNYLQELHALGVTIIMITHSDDVAAVAGRKISISDGVVAADTGPVDRRKAAYGRTKDEDGPQRLDDADPVGPKTGGVRSRWLLAEALTALLLTPLRSLTILAAFVVAISGLVTAVNMTASAANQVSTTLSAAALDEVVVRLPTQGAMSAAAARVRTLDGVEGVSSVVSVSANEALVSRPTGDFNVSTSSEARVVDSDYFRIHGIQVWPSQAVDVLAAEDGSPAVILGPDLAAELGISTDRVGEIISVGGQRVVVAGFIRGSNRDATLATTASVSLADYSPPEGSTYGLIVRTEPGLPARIAEAIPLTVDPAHPENVQVQTVADLRELTKGVNSDLAINVLLTSAVLLVLVCLTSSISMFLTVLARTREIALRRAVGATKGNVRTLFLLEGALLGFAGGSGGTALGVAATTIICLVLTWSPTFDPLGAAVAMAAGTLAGAVSAIVPARRAARIEPAIALRAV